MLVDTTKDVIYRGFKLNDSAIDTTRTSGGAIGTGITGCVIDSMDLSDVDVVQFTEKRSLQDGADAGDVYLGMRRVRLAGTLYGKTRALLSDALADLRAAMSPTLSQRSVPQDKGYQPLYFSSPTNRISEYPTGSIDKLVNAMPRSFSELTMRDNLGGDAGDALAIPWQAIMVMRDPRIMSAVTADYPFTATTIVTGATIAAATDLVTIAAHGLSAGNRVYFTTLTGGTGLTVGTAYYVLASGLTSGAFKVSLTNAGAAVDVTVDATVASYVKLVSITGNFVNRGNYHAQLNGLWQVGAQGGTIVISGGGSNMTITVPASTGTRIVRYKGEDKVVTIEENSVETLRMDLFTFQNLTTHPLVPGGTSAYTVTHTGIVLLSGCHLWFWESLA